MKNEIKYNNPEVSPEKEPEIHFEIAKKDEELKNKVMDLLHEYPEHFVHELFEEAAEKDFENSDIMVACQDDEIVGCLMFNRKINEFNWLAVSKKIKEPKTDIARRLFESFYPTIEQGTVVHFFVNTEDAYIPGNKSFSGKNFEAARKLYRSMGLELKKENIVKNKYGRGSHAYKVAWKIENDK
ncbi:hypothetical protein KJ969_03435 [Patescibacteria group bacterium]|nr:hypothetical protein [Patescibacteria group bacterium]MBU1922425.1 hypothetical protein [Patescibacteria group bacterium]